MPTNTYTPLANLTLGSSAASVTFSSISQAYRDLVLVMQVKTTGSNTLARMTFNSDTATNYSRVNMVGNGSTATSTASADDGIFACDVSSSDFYVQINQVMDYSATDKHTSVLTRTAREDRTIALAQRWANTAAVTTATVTIAAGSFAAGSTFSLFGVAA